MATQSKAQALAQQHKNATPPAPPACTICGKTLKRGSTIKNGMGATCAHNSTIKTPAQWQAHFAKLTKPVPAGFVSVASLNRTIKANKHKPQFAGLTITKMVNAIGKDKAVLPPHHPIAQVIYNGGQRWVNPFMATPAGLTCIATGNWDNAPTK